jgi:AAA family ATP:ADP antiporter
VTPAAAGREQEALDWSRLSLSTLYFGLLLASYYMVRPLRDALAAGSGPDTIKYLATAVFFVMLAIVPVFGWLVARVPRARLLPLTYAFFVANLVAFGLGFRLDPESRLLARIFYVWTTVFSMFVVAVFWSFMADIWREQQGRRVFGVIAAGGSLGGLVGPLVAKSVAGVVGTAGVAFAAALTLSGTVACIVLLSRGVRAAGGAGRVRIDEPVGGEILAGLVRLARSPFLLGLAALVVINSLLGMMVYIELAQVAAVEYATAAARTGFYAQRDLWVNGGSLVLQLLVGFLTGTLGVRATLSGSAAVATLGFLALAAVPVAGVLVALNVLLRALEFGVAKPSRDMLYTVVDAETKYKVKNVIDTVVYRGTDMLSGWMHGLLVALGASLAVLAAGAAAVGLAFVAIAWAVGTGYRRRGGA